MTPFLDKLRSGNVPTDHDWNLYLEQAHGKAPGMSPKAFGSASYQRLSQVIDRVHPRPKRILDLACGDGHLVPFCLQRLDADARVLGIDMSKAELELARKNHASERVTFRRESAQALTLPDQSVDLVLCHMAFMLMLPVEPVVAQIRRVLRPGGTFAAVVGHREGGRGLYAELLKILTQVLQEELPSLAQARMGDPRTRTLEGWRELFPGLTVEVEELFVELSFEPAARWGFFRDFYLVDSLSEEAQLRLRESLAAVVSDSPVLECPMRLYTVAIP